jgi:hypothetical protein
VSKHIVIPDPHSTPGVSNERAEWIGKLINDEKPDTVIVLGDTADMSSLCTYDRGKKSFQGRTYKADILAHSDFQDRLWSTVRSAKKRMPHRITLIGNHEQRIERAIEVQPELEGQISYADLELDHWYDTVVPYTGSTPGTIDCDGVTYAHYLVSGIAGRPISGEHHAYSILSKKFASCTVGHSHLLDYCVRTQVDGRRLQGLVAGCYQEHDSAFAGEANKLWWRGVIIKRNVEDGTYDPQFVSLDTLRKEYGR